MRLALLTTLAMIAFAANSLLTRLGVFQSGLDPVAFAALRVLAGAAMLLVLVQIGRRPLQFTGAQRWIGAAALATYMLGFSLAYLDLEAGIGALILFGTVQVTMFAGGVLAREVIPRTRIIGAAVACVGLVYLLLPGTSAPPALASFLMVAAGIGWGIYSLVGRRETDPLAGTAGNFLLCLIAMAAAFVFLQEGTDLPLSGVIYAVVSGAIASALGYALWYALLPQLGATRAAVAQLSVPVIALAAGAVLLDEVITWRIAFASALVLGGIAFSLWRR